MKDVSFLIPARNEEYLGKTIKNILDNIRGNSEVIAVLDGYLPDPALKFDERVKFIHYEKSIGQRASINAAARVAEGKYVCKIDAHCAIDEGFDIKMMADCEYDWTVCPTMYNLDVETWLPKRHKKTDYMYFSSPSAEQPFRAQYYTGQEYRKWHRRKELIDDILCVMGPCFFIHKERFLEQGGCDEGHGSWGNQGIEVSLKAWLSGGALKVNRKTWFAHWFRGGGGPGFPYQISGNDQERARKYSRNLWLNNKWEGQVRPLSWLLEKFKPVPTWHDEIGNNALDVVNDLGLIFSRTHSLTSSTNSLNSPISIKDSSIQKGMSMDTMSLSSINSGGACSSEGIISVSDESKMSRVATLPIVTDMINLKNTSPAPSFDGINQPGINESMDFNTSVNIKELPITSMINLPNPVPTSRIVVKTNALEESSDSFEVRLNRKNVLHGRSIPKVMDNVKDLTILFYTANVISKKILEPVVRSLKGHNIPIVSVTQEPMDLGINIVTPKKRSLQNIYRQVLIGAKQATTKYVALCEDDCIYQREHFDYRPKEAPFAYNLNRWLLHLDERIFSYRKRPVLSQCIANREALIKTLEERLALPTIPDKYCGEPGCFEDKLGITQYKYETFETKNPNMVVCHEKNTMGRKLVGEDAEPKTELEPYGHVDYWANKFTSISEYEHRRVRKQYCHISGRPYNVDHLLENLEHYWDSRKKSRFPYYFSAVFPFFKEVHEGKEFTDEELKAHPYFKYLLFRMKEESRELPSTIERCLFLIKSAIILYNNIKNNGMYLPLDMWFDGKKFNLYRGSRRLAIAKLLGYNTIPVRIFNSLDLLGKFMPDRDMKPGDDTINGLAIKQFIKYKQDATDKYWVHSYTSQYDMHFLPLRQTTKKVLEVGVKKGASLLIWKDVFPNAHIYGVDKDISKANMVHGVSGITLMQGLQEDEKFIKEQVVPNGKFDIIIDDASHIGIDQQKSFKVLWDCVEKGGYYVVEDLYRNYVDKGEHNTMTMFKSLIDEMNLKGEISEMHFYYNICFIRRR